MGRKNGKGRTSEERKGKKKLLVIGIIIIVIAIISLAFSGPVNATDEFFGGFLLGFGVILLIAGILLTIIAFYRVSTIEFEP